MMLHNIIKKQCGWLVISLHLMLILWKDYTPGLIRHFLVWLHQERWKLESELTLGLMRDVFSEMVKRMSTC